MNELWNKFKTDIKLALSRSNAVGNLLWFVLIWLAVGAIGTINELPAATIVVCSIALTLIVILGLMDHRRRKDIEPLPEFPTQFGCWIEENEPGKFTINLGLGLDGLVYGVTAGRWQCSVMNPLTFQWTFTQTGEGVIGSNSKVVYPDDFTWGGDIPDPLPEGMYKVHWSVGKPTKGGRRTRLQHAAECSFIYRRNR